MKVTLSSTASSLAGLLLALAIAPASAAEIKVLAAGATKETYLELVPQFEKSSGHKAVTTWSGTVNIKKRIADGEVEIGFQQVSELIHFPGIDYIGPLPAGLQKITVYSSGVHSGAKQPDVAKALVKFLTAPAAAPVIKKHGMEPG